MSKKGAKAAPKEVPSYVWRDIVLGKVRGYPPWPGMIVDPDTAPEAVKHERPAKKSNFYCVRFFPTGDFAWLVAKDISKLQKHEIESYITEPFKKSGDLLQGYRVALDPESWEADRASALAASVAVLNEAGAAADAAAAPEDEGGEVDELETDDEGKKKAKSKKRKRDSETAPKTRKAVGATTKEKKEKATTAKKANAGKSRKKSKPTVGVESEDDGADAEGEDAGPSSKKAGTPPPAKKARRDKEEEHEDSMTGDPEAIKVRDWRHRLQKAFLSNKNQPPEDTELVGLDQLFSTVEAYHTMTVSHLQFSKIGKVMRHITLLPTERLPKDTEYHFRDRAKALVERWQLVLGTAKGGENGSISAAPNGSGSSPAKDVTPKEDGKETGIAKDHKTVAAAGGEGVNGADDGSAKVTTGTAAMDLNGTAAEKSGGDDDATMTNAEGHADADATGDADADVSGQADAPGEADDVAMAEAEA